MAYSAELIESVDEFANRINRYCIDNFLGTNVIQTTVNSIRTGKRTYERCFWWILWSHHTSKEGDSDVDKSICGIAMRTLPQGYVLHCLDLAALPSFITVLIATEDEMLLKHEGQILFPFISGKKETIIAFKELYEKMFSDRHPNDTMFRKAKSVESELLYTLTTLIPARPIIHNHSVEIITPTEEDTTLVFNWLQLFVEEIGVYFPDLMKFVQMAIKAQNYRILIVDGVKVTIGGRTEIVNCGENEDGQAKKLSRIAPIFTPKEYRGHGYASTITAHLAQEILDEGAVPMLFTQALNPISNAIYQKIGFEFVEENFKVIY